ncbi:sulfotransferase family protein [Methylophaga sp. OBS4]|uniref:sulfotransferase family protein n=1 Tax=Methylophaga sp. OBS4 TaxID=2991935 RepID=UPI00225311CF|nr:sulfotransferase [Methylophaga sp. OBS4]MCX4188428.1 sulfotransferase [Methylophaga sp. OBS4]
MVDNDNSCLIFVCGALRSGTSLLHLMLNKHPRLSNPGEFDFLFDMIGEDGSYPDVDTYINWLHTHRIFIAKLLSIPDSVQNFQQLLSGFVRQLSQPDKVLTLNVHRHFHRIPPLFPDAKYIHLIRDPRDVARSSIGMGWAGNVFYGVDHWLESEHSWQKLKSQLSAVQFIEIRFEDLIAEPEATLRKLCEFVAVPYDDEMLNYAATSTYAAPDISLINQWQTKLSSQQIQQVEFKAAQLMKSLGYQTSGQTTVEPGLWKRLYLFMQNKLYKLQFEIKRYGFCLSLTGRLARWLMLNGLQKSARLKKNEIDKQVLK